MGNKTKSQTEPRKTSKRKGKTKLSVGKPSLKKLKNWQQISELDYPLEDWPAYRQSLALRLPLIHWRTVWNGKSPALAWMVGGLPEDSRLGPWWKWLQSVSVDKPLKPKHAQAFWEDADAWAGQVDDQLGMFRRESSTEQQRVQLGLEVLTVAWLLPWVSAEAESSQFGPLLDRMIAWSKEEWDANRFPLLAQWLGIELPVTLDYQFPDLAQVSEVGKLVPQRLSQAMDPCIDGNGLPSANCTPIFGLLLACWTRVYQLGQAMESPLFVDQTDDHYQWAARQALRLLRSDGTLLWSENQKSSSDNEFLQTLLHCDDDLEDWQAAALQNPTIADLAPASALRIKENRLPDPADESEWGKTAILRSKWKAKSDKLAINFGGRDIQLELENHRSWLKGPLETRVRVDGKDIGLDETWSEVCWHTDDDCVYLEIQNELDNAVGIIQRQFLLSRHYRFCMIADSVLLNRDAENPRSRSIDHYWGLPLADKVSFEAARETHEGHLIAGKHQLSVLPLTLPEWRVEFSRGSLSTEKHQLLTHYSLPTDRLFQAVLIDLDHRRSREPLTWRSLLVGQNLQPVSIDEAVGFRVQLDRMQFLLYRSLGKIAGRTVLGHNYYCDFYAGQFQPDGLCEDILMINGPED